MFPPDPLLKLGTPSILGTFLPFLELGAPFDSLERFCLWGTWNAFRFFGTL